MNADLEVSLQPVGEVLDELFAEVATVSRPSLLEAVIKVPLGNL
jgi:hypothetical protein